MTNGTSIFYLHAKFGGTADKLLDFLSVCVSGDGGNFQDICFAFRKGFEIAPLQSRNWIDASECCHVMITAAVCCLVCYNSWSTGFSLFRNSECRGTADICLRRSDHISPLLQGLSSLFASC